MGLFSSTQMSWSEPYFFLIRLREAWGWRNRVLLGLAVAALLFLAILLTGRQRLDVWQSLGVSLAAAGVLLALLDVGNIQREVTITDDRIIYNSAVGTLWLGEFLLKDIRRVQLMWPGNWNRPWGAMLIQTDNDGFLLGVPHKVSLVAIANVLHRLGVSVSLEGWEPSESDSRVQVKDEIALPEDAARQTGRARIWQVGDDEAKLEPPFAVTIGVTIALGPLLLSLLGLIAAAVYLFLKWGALAAADRWMIGGVALAALVVSFLYLLVAGQFLAARYGIAVARSIVRTRPGAQLSGLEEDVIPVEIFDRAAWTSMIVKSTDFGFLQIDEGRRGLRFEGNKHRWEIPVSALTACRIEEAHVGSEGETNAEKRYYVVIACDRDGEPWEAGMTHSRTALGYDGKAQRYQRAQKFFERISGLLAKR